ncbi:DNA-binding response regulator [Pseudoroseomonas globiformis]|uniref:DNA-binding response regulator n=1 Tax=Teichococcus globiformis TaxID=2307229 RepID=A0ABV7G8Z9_9PROT
MQQALAEQQNAAVVLVDPRPLRRTGWVGLLSGWAEANGLRIEAAEPDAIAGLSNPGAAYRLAILSLGATSLQDPTASAWLAAIMEAVPQTPLVVVSDLEDASEVVAAYRAKARGFVPTTTEPEVALRTFAFIMGGGSFFPPTALFGRSEQRQGQEASARRPVEAPIRTGRSDLTGRQGVVMEHLAAGLTNKAIARLLGMRESTVKVHVRQIMRKLGATNRTQAALAAASAEPAAAKALGMNGEVPAPEAILAEHPRTPASEPLPLPPGRTAGDGAEPRRSLPQVGSGTPVVRLITRSS